MDASASSLPFNRGGEGVRGVLGLAPPCCAKKDKPPAGARGLRVEVRSDYGTKDTIAPDKTSLPEAWITAMPLGPFC